MGFLNTLKHSINKSGTLGRRARYLKYALEHFSFMASFSYTGALERLTTSVGTQPNEIWNHDQISRMLEIIKSERENYLLQLLEFEKIRKARKASGHQQVSKIEALLKDYKDNLNSKVRQLPKLEVVS